LLTELEHELEDAHAWKREAGLAFKKPVRPRFGPSSARPTALLTPHCAA